MMSKYVSLRSLSVLFLAVSLLLLVCAKVINTRIEEHHSTTKSNGRSIWSRSYRADSERTYLERFLGLPSADRIVWIQDRDDNWEVQLNTLEKLSSLEELALWGLDVSNRNLSSRAIPHLRSLWLYDCSPKTVRYAINRASPNSLQSLRLSECSEVSDEDLAELPNLISLQTISIEVSSLQGTVMASFAQCRSLERLEIMYSPCCDANDISQLASIASLRFLRISGDGRFLDVSKLACLENLSELSIEEFEIKASHDEILKASISAVVNTDSCVLID